MQFERSCTSAAILSIRAANSSSGNALFGDRRNLDNFSSDRGVDRYRSKLKRVVRMGGEAADCAISLRNFVS
jgi:hypothetical protein